ncbi:MAG: PadR family transcriptional regulator [Candidatus Bathyarchaeota archaeon]|nr:PadR family transcriptional regulator [Candidatus Bathyarchaeota archaeon]
MLSATTEKNAAHAYDFVVEEKGKFLKAYSEVTILAEMNKRLGLSATDVIALFKEKYGKQMSPGTIYPLLRRMEQKKLIKLIPNRRKKFYVLTDSGKKALNDLQLNLKEIQVFIFYLLTK